MSEYQYYEFFAEDEPLDMEAIGELRAVSSRAEITAHRFSVVYNWSDLKARPVDLMARYFDLHVYVANWGSNRFMVRVPSDLVPLEVVEPYLAPVGLGAMQRGESLILDLGSEVEDPAELDDFEDFGDGSEWMDELRPLRCELIGGDLRMAYLGWLSRVGSGDLGDDQPEPPVPCGLGELSPALSSLVELLRLDRSLVEVAAERSEPMASFNAGLVEWLTELPGGTKDWLLLRVLEGHHARACAEIRGRYRAEVAGAEAGPAAPEPRTAGELRERAAILREAHQREAARRRAEREAREKAEAAAARALQLDELEGREDQLWKEVERLLRAGRPSVYPLAVQRLVDLRDLASRAGTEAAFADLVRKLTLKHSGKKAFLRRLDAAVPVVIDRA